MAEQPLTYTGYAVTEPSLDFKKVEFTAPALVKDQVTLDIIVCGICHSDIHASLGEWKDVGINMAYPLSPGHEVIGIVTEVGPNCTLLKIGDRVGVGPQRDSCLSYPEEFSEPCEFCQVGETQLCRNKNVTLYGLDTGYSTGGFSSKMRISEKFAFKIPETIDSQSASVMLCAGVTVFSPLYRYNLTAKRRSKVCVLGVGGLGHLAVAIAAAMGHEVTVITRSGDKEELCKQLGATHFATSTPENLDAHKHKFDFVVSTISGNSGSMNQYLLLVKPRGQLCFLGLGSTDLSFNPTILLFNDVSIAGSGIGGIFLQKEMLEFMALHKINPMISVVDAPFEQEGSEKIVSQACQDVVKGLPRFRYVLDYKKDAANQYLQYIEKQ